MTGKGAFLQHGGNLIELEVACDTYIATECTESKCDMWAYVGILIEVSVWNRSQWKDVIKEWKLLVCIKEKTYSSSVIGGCHHGVNHCEN